MKKLLAAAAGSVFLLTLLSGCSSTNSEPVPSEPAPVVSPTDEAPLNTGTPVPESPMLPGQIKPGNGMPESEALAAQALVSTYLPTYRDAVCGLVADPTAIQPTADTFTSLLGSVTSDPLLVGSVTGDQFRVGLEKMNERLDTAVTTNEPLSDDAMGKFTIECNQADDLLADQPAL